jgi:hypothetical protein
VQRKRYRVVHKDGSWKVDLPTYEMVPGSFLPVIAGKSTANGPLPGTAPNDPAMSGATVQVDIPDEDVKQGGETNAQYHARLDARYREHAGRFRGVEG